LGYCRAFVLSLVWLISEYASLGVKPDPGNFFAWEMLAMIIPGILTAIALVGFCASRIAAQKRK